MDHGIKQHITVDLNLALQRDSWNLVLKHLGVRCKLLKKDGHDNLPYKSDYLITESGVLSRVVEMHYPRVLLSGRRTFE